MSYDKLMDILKEKNSFRVVSHVLPDGDSIGSTVALTRVLELMHKDVKAFSHDPVPIKYQFLLPYHSYIKEISLIDTADVLLVVDCNDLSRTGLEPNDRDKFNIVVNIDHHITNNYFGDLDIVDFNASASGELLFNLFFEKELPFNQEIAEALYTAIVTDTGSFKYQNTTSNTHKVIAELLKHPIDYSGITHHIFDERPLSFIMLLKQALSTLELWHHQRIACLTINEEMRLSCGAAMEDLDGIVNYAKNIEGVEIGILMYIYGNGEIKVGLRSKEVNVSRLAEYFEGGGHYKAAGFRINAPYQKAKNSIIDSSSDFLSNYLLSR